MAPTTLHAFLQIVQIYNGFDVFLIFLLKLLLKNVADFLFVLFPQYNHSYP